MDEVTDSRSVLITKTVSVVFDHDNRPEYTEGDGRYQAVEELTRFQLAAIQIKFTYDLKFGEWRNPWRIRVERSRVLKDGSWGKPIGADMYGPKELTDELCNKYRPTTTITITEKSN